MSRITARPTALLDGTEQPARVVLPDSDAERRYDAGQVFAHVPSFIGHLALLGDRRLPRTLGFAKLIQVGGVVMSAIQGEDVAAGKPEVMYGFALGPDSGEFIQISRVVAGEGTTLAWTAVQQDENPVFRTPDLRGVIEEPAKIDELTQILAAGQDAAEWALD